MNIVGILQSQEHVHFILEGFTHSEKVLFHSIQRNGEKNL